MSRTPSRGITGALLPRDATAPIMLKNKKNPMIPMMKRPQTTARVIFTKSFIFYFNLFAVLAKIKILCDNHLFIINFARYGTGLA